jgi:DNA primase
MEFSSDFKEQVRSQTDIVGLIGESVTLIPERGGQEFKCLCPFHDDNNPSMRVYPERQSYRCWVCDEAGDVYSWVMKREGLSFPEALELLANRAHLEMPRRSKGETSKFARKNDLYEVLKWAEIQFHECLLNSAQGEIARLYLDERGYTDETIRKFRLGYHPNDWEWLLKRAGKQFPAKLLVEARLAAVRQNSSSHYDYFVHRVLFPIHDEQRRTVAFGGRVIPGQTNDDQAKYWNSPESAVFYKSQVLFGLPDAKEGIKQENCVLVTEGYADCIACQQFGVTNVVATLGTALTDRHVNRLKAFAPKIVMVYDGDTAGQNAANRAIELLLGYGVDLRVLTLPDGQDPDDFLQEQGADAFRSLVQEAPEAWEFRLRYEIAKNGVDAINGREKVAESMLSLLAGVPGLAGTPREDLILGRVGKRLRMSEKALRKELERIRRETPQHKRPSNPLFGQQNQGGKPNTFGQKPNFKQDTSFKPNTSGSSPQKSNAPAGTGNVPPADINFSEGFTVYAEDDDVPVHFDGELSSSEAAPGGPNSSNNPPPQLSTYPQSQEETPALPPVDLHKKRLSKDDMLDLEVLEMLFTRPEFAVRTAQEIGVDDIHHPHLKMLLQVVYDLVELGEEPRFERVTLELEQLELKGLAVWIADQARLKGIEQKLLGDKTEDGTPVLYAENLKRLKWRREEVSHQQQLNRDAMSESGPGEDALAKLKQAAAFHRKRVSNE